MSSVDALSKTTSSQSPWSCRRTVSIASRSRSRRLCVGMTTENFTDLPGPMCGGGMREAENGDESFIIIPVGKTVSRKDSQRIVLKFERTPLEGVFALDLVRLEDERGFFARSFCQREFEAHGLN